MNIVLIGMPGAGKSTIGVILAKEIGYRFYDTDLIIQNEKKMLLQEIINKYGIEEFLKIEDEIVSSQKFENSVIATGGSVVYSKNSIINFKENSKIVYLNLNIEEIIKRLKNIKTRGIPIKEGKTIYDVYEERKVLYEKYADYTINTKNKNIEKVVAEIIKVTS